MRHGSLFTGIGGFDLSASWLNWKNIFQVESDGYCQKILAKNFPNVKRYGDIKEFDGTKYRGLIDIISGGVPCQPASVAGKRKGEKDDRWLWDEALRVFGEIEPANAIFENPLGILSLDNGKPFERICSEMENKGYKVTPIIIPACCVGAWHRRDRIWIIANSIRESSGNENKTANNKGWRTDEDRASGLRQRNRKACTSGIITTDSITVTDPRLQRQAIIKEQTTGIEQCSENVPNTNGQRFPSFRKSKRIHETKGETRTNIKRECLLGREWNPDWWDSEPSVGRVANGISNRVDRLKGLGNAIVPQIAYQIFKAIEEYENTKKKTQGNGRAKSLPEL